MLIRLSTVLLAVLVIAVLAACTVSPTGRQQFAILSPARLSAEGDQAFEQMKQQQPIETDPRINNYVRCVAYGIVSQLPNRGNWEVVVFRDEDPNAFALPGGQIGVNTGIFKVARNQHQLAAVIGHEVGHVLAHHHNERASQELATGLVLAAGGALANSAGYGVSPEIMQALGMGAQIGFLLPYSRAHESEADVIGLDLMARAGFDPRESLALWQNMARAGGAESPEFVSTHPANRTRLQDLQAVMPQAMQTFAAARAQGHHPDCR